MISVLRGDFLRKILALVAMDLNEVRIPTGTIKLGWIRDEKNVRIHYRSGLSSGSALREQAPALLANLSRCLEINACVDAEAFVLTMTFPLVELSEARANTPFQAWNRYRRYSSWTMTKSYCTRCRTSSLAKIIA